MVMATRFGVIKKTALSDFNNIRKSGLIAVNLKDGDELIGVAPSLGDDSFILATHEGKCIRFHEGNVRAMGRTATGVRSIRLDEGDFVIGMAKVIPGCDVLTVTENGMGKRTPESSYREQGRGGKGIIAMNITEKTGKLNSLAIVDGTEDLLLICYNGMVIRMPVSQISVTNSRSTQGVILMRPAEGDSVTSIALAPHYEETDDPEAEAVPAVDADAPDVQNDLTVAPEKETDA